MLVPLLKIGLKRSLQMLMLCQLMIMAGCQTFYQTFPPSTDLYIKADKTINPDLNGRASPVVVRVYELAARSVFDSQDFFTLYDNPEAVLKNDLLSRKEFEIQPGSRIQQRFEFQPAARYIGVLVAYRDLDKATWKTVAEVDPTGYDDLYLYLEKLTAYVRDFDLDKRAKQAEVQSNK